MLSKIVSWETFINLQRRRKAFSYKRKLRWDLWQLTENCLLLPLYSWLQRKSRVRAQRCMQNWILWHIYKTPFSILELFCMRSTLKSLQKVPIWKIFISNNFDGYQNAQKVIGLRTFVHRNQRWKGILFIHFHANIFLLYELFDIFFCRFEISTIFCVFWHPYQNYLKQMWEGGGVILTLFANIEA